MEDGNGIELSLGLLCGGAVDKVKSKDSSSIDLKAEEKGYNDNNSNNNRSSSLMGDVKSFHTTIIEIDESDTESKRSDKTNSAKETPQENFFTNLGNSSSVGDATINLSDPKFIKYEGLWVGNDKSKAIEEGKSDYRPKMGQNLWQETINKRKMMFEEINYPKKHEREVQHVETHAIFQRPLHASSEALNDERKASELAQGGGKQHVIEEGGASSSPRTRDEVRENSINFRSNEASRPQVMDGFPPEGSAIRPGIAPGLTFGGSGSYPNLPWVSTTGPGPNGITISGVAYRYEKDQVKIVCACHGSHMSCEEFIQHAHGDQPNLEDNNTDILSYSNSNNNAASTKS